MEHLRSDNATIFTGAEKELKKTLVTLNQEMIQRAMSQVGICWSFNPLASSHHGGVGEHPPGVKGPHFCPTSADIR